MSLIPRDSNYLNFEDDWFLENQPKLDLYEKDNNLFAELNIPDFDPEKIDIVIENGSLKVNGFLEEKKEEKDKGYFYKEISKGSFERIIRLPFSIKEDKIEAEYEKGVLKIKMPKDLEIERKKPKIQIKRLD